jgi:hypothetical protein
MRGSLPSNEGGATFARHDPMRMVSVDVYSWLSLAARGLGAAPTVAALR